MKTWLQKKQDQEMDGELHAWAQHTLMSVVSERVAEFMSRVLEIHRSVNKLSSSKLTPAFLLNIKRSVEVLNPRERVHAGVVIRGRQHGRFCYVNTDGRAEVDYNFFSCQIYPGSGRVLDS